MDGLEGTWVFLGCGPGARLAGSLPNSDRRAKPPCYIPAIVLEPGQIFAVRYRVIKLLAQGGMGAVFEAQHTGTERRVAIKLLWPQVMAIASAREKFELEAKVAARVNSEHIVHVSDAGFDEGTQAPYLVMELLDGQTLGARVQDGGPLGADEAVSLLRQVASGLDAAHGYRDERGIPSPIVHRDLKPENLFITTQRGGASMMKILDFGIAKVLSESTNVSQEVKGTPLYMAYEQVTAGVLSPQTDIWALGLITYHALTGRRYWRSAQKAGAGVQSLFGEILSLPMDPPSVRIRQQGSDLQLPAAFDAWLLRCLDREPQRRYASAGEAIQELARAFEGAPRLAASSRVQLTPELGLGATATFHGARGRLQPSSTEASLPALSSERAGVAVRAPVVGTTLRWQMVAAVLAVAMPVGAGMLWLLSEEDPDLAPAAQPPASTALPSASLPSNPHVPLPTGATGPLPPRVDSVSPAPVQPGTLAPPATVPPTVTEVPAWKPVDSDREDPAETETRTERKAALRAKALAPPRTTPQKDARPKDSSSKKINPYDDLGFGPSK